MPPSRVLAGASVRTALAGLVDLAMPRRCACCGAHARLPVCPGCADLVALQVSAAPLPASAMPPALAQPPPLAAAAPYEGAVRDLILCFKERGRWGARQLLGALLAEAVAALPDRPPSWADACEPVSLVPVPPSPGRRATGHDPAGELALGACRALRGSGRPARVLPLLRCVRAVADQAGLTEQARVANVERAFTCRPAAAHSARLVLVDDVVTTGATLAEAARALRDGGVPLSGLAVVAATRRLRASDPAGKSGC